MEVYLPRTADENELINAVNIAYRALGRSLGSFYDEMLAPTSPTWFRDLEAERRKVLSLHDPYFVLDEPLRNSGSITRACLPRNNGQLWDAMEKARLARNRWVHAEQRPTPRAAGDAVKPLIVIAQCVKLDVAGDFEMLLERVQAIHAGNEFTESVDSAQVAELMREIEAEQAAREAALDATAEAYAKAQSEFAEKQALAEKAGDLERRIAELEISLADAMDGWGRAVAMAEESASRQAAEQQAEIERLRELVRPAPDPVVLPEGIKPGDPWPEDLPMGGWDLDLRAGLDDFLVLGTKDTLGELLPDEPVAVFARQCLEIVPVGGLMYVDHCGHVVRDAYPSAMEQTYVGTMPVEWVEQAQQR